MRPSYFCLHGEDDLEMRRPCPLRQQRAYCRRSRSCRLGPRIDASGSTLHQVLALGVVDDLGGMFAASGDDSAPAAGVDVLRTRKFHAPFDARSRRPATALFFFFFFKQRGGPSPCLSALRRSFAGTRLPFTSGVGSPVFAATSRPASVMPPRGTRGPSTVRYALRAGTSTWCRTERELEVLALAIDPVALARDPSVYRVAASPRHHVGDNVRYSRAAPARGACRWAVTAPSPTRARPRSLGDGCESRPWGPSP